MDPSSLGSIRARLPQRFRITIHTVDDESFDYSVVSWFGRDKAVAIAALAHKGRRAGKGVYRVQVEDLGPLVEGTDPGEIQGDEFLDRAEW